MRAHSPHREVGVHQPLQNSGLRHRTEDEIRQHRTREKQPEGHWPVPQQLSRPDQAEREILAGGPPSSPIPSGIDPTSELSQLLG